MDIHCWILLFCVSLTMNCCSSCLSRSVKRETSISPWASILNSGCVYGWDCVEDYIVGSCGLMWYAFVWISAFKLEVMMRSAPWNFWVVCASVPERSGDDGICELYTLTLATPSLLDIDFHFRNFPCWSHVLLNQGFDTTSDSEYQSYKLRGQLKLDWKIIPGRTQHAGQFRAIQGIRPERQERKNVDICRAFKPI